MGEGPGLVEEGWLVTPRWMFRCIETHKGDEVVEEHHDEADDGKVEQVSPVGEFRLFAELVVGDHDAGGHDEGENNASKDDENVLGNETPWRMAGSQESRLSKRYHQ